MNSAREPIPAAEDVSLLCAAISAAMNRSIRETLTRAGFDDARDSHGYIFQHLLDGPVTIGELAARLGLTQQAISKSTIELERLGYVRRVADPDDQRVRNVELAERGWAAIDAGRAARAALNDHLRRQLGESDLAKLINGLQAVGAEVGALDDLETRNLVPPG